MIIILRSEEITEWFVCFHTSCTSALWNRIIPGRFKHVRVFGWSPGCRVWVFYDTNLLGGSQIFVAPAGKLGDDAVGEYTRDASVLKLSRREGRLAGYLGRIGFWCVPAVRHLLNLPGGALLPDALWRDCIKADARIVIEHERREFAPALPDA